MKMMMQRFVVVMAMAAGIVAGSSIAQANPGFGGSCSSCHGAPGGALDVMDLITIMPGETVQISFDVTDVPQNDAAIALSGLDQVISGPSDVGTGWAFVAPFNQWASDPFFESAGVQVLDLTVPADTVPGNYGVNVQLAGGPGFGGWSSIYGFTIEVTEVIPEPASLALLLTGFGAVGLLGLRRRRGRAA